MSNWQKIRLGDICILHYGKALTATKRVAGDIPVYSSAGITGWHNKSLLDSRSIIVGRKGTVGSVYLCAAPFWCIDTAYYILPKDDIYNFKYLYYRLCSLGLNKLNEDSAVPGLNRETAYAQEFMLPPLTEQERIAAILGSLDDKIELNNRINKNLEEQASALFKRWFVDFEFPDTSTFVELGDVIQTTSGGTPSRSKTHFYERGKIKWVKSKELQGSFIIDTEERITEDAVKNSSVKYLSKNSILIAMYGATVGEYAIISDVMTCNQAICALIPNESYPYTYLFMFAKQMKEELVNSAIGSAQQNISQVIIRKLLVSTDLERIKKFDMIAQPLFEAIKNKIEENQALVQLRDSLLPKLMNNELKV